MAHLHQRNGGAKNPPTKKAKMGDSQEDEEMDMDMDFDTGFAEDDLDQQLGNMDMTAEEVETPSNVSYDKWERPRLTEWNPRSKSLAFQQIDLDHYIASQPVHGMPGSKIGPVPVIRYTHSSHILF